MKGALRLLIVEDVEEDAELLLHDLERGGYRVASERVETADAMRSALAKSWDLIVSDFSMPTFSAPEALRILDESGRDIPFIIISGTIGEEAAIDALKAGAEDFLIKGRHARLIPAVERALREAGIRNQSRAAEEALHASEARYRALFECSPIPIFIVDDDSERIIDANAAAIRTYGYSKDELCALAMSDIRVSFPPSAELLGGAPFSGLLRHRKRDGTTIDVESVTDRLSLEGRRVRLEMVSDRTERTRIEEQLRQAQKMEAVGRLAAGVAHDLNNMLTPILSYTGMILADLSEEQPIREDLNEIRKAGERAQALTEQLLAFSRQKVLQPELVDLNECVWSLEKMLQKSLGGQAELELRLASQVDSVLIDANEVAQILMNLVINARDALSKSGRVTITTKNVLLDEAQARQQVGAKAGRHVLLSVSDTGIGMDPATRARIFEPFFTTKPSGKGTGLGLATVFAIVSKSGGRISVTSEPGLGTTFEILLPSHAGAGHARRSSGPHALAVTDRGTETVLLAEDDPMVRRSIRAVLQQRGYTVLEAQGGLEAVALSERYEGVIHLLLTDVVMPVLGGRELAERISAMRPETKVLYMSGYTGDLSLQKAVFEAGVPYLQKPFRPDVLARKIRSVLDAKSEPLPHPR